MKKPSSIFRFQPISTRALQNLLGKALFFSSPMNFNDPFDCAIGGRIGLPTEEALEKLRMAWLRSRDIEEGTKEEVKNAPLDVLASSLIRMGSKVFIEERNKFRNSNGIICFSETNENVLMWSHYADNCKGMCLEFCTDIDPFDQIRKVKYKREFPKLNMLSALSKSKPSNEILKLFVTKSLDWKYEKEWRLIHHNANQLYFYDPKALKAVYFGSGVELPQIMLVCSTIQSAYENVKFFKGKTSEIEFKMEFEEFRYTTPKESTKFLEDNQAVEATR